MQKRLLSLCLVLALLLCACGQKAASVSPTDAPSAPKQEVSAVTPAEKESAEKEETPTAPAEKVTEAPTTQMEKSAAEDTAVSNQESVSDTTKVDTPVSNDPVPSAPPIQPSAESCTISIVCHTAVGKNDAAPTSGVILSSTAVTLSGGESVYDVLCTACSANGIALSGNSGYIKSIGGLAERACGGGSGWLYRVNGAVPGVGCGSYAVTDGDSIEWVYTCEMGNDL